MTTKKTAARIEFGRKPHPKFFESLLLTDIGQKWVDLKTELLAKYSEPTEEAMAELEERREALLKTHRYYPKLLRLRATWDPETQTHRE